jgi:hypothetical protein
MLSEWLLEIFVKDLTKLKDEIGQYKDEKDIWIIKGEIKNSAGNLCLHLLGNVNHTIGNLIGGTGYQRNRDQEFMEKNISRAELISRIDAAVDVVKKSLPKLKDEAVNQRYPVTVGGKDRETGYALIYFANHFNYHLGQINYHRRLIAVR